ncbi:MAG: ABC transporter permease [Actinomycetota bacterium]|nr:ABC transporter permease [Actinomycetota bacterium]
MTEAPTPASRTGAIGRRVLRQIIRDRRFLVTALVAPLLIVFFVETLFDAAGTPDAVTTRFVVPFGAYIVHFATFILTAIVLVRERVAETLERMFVNGYRQLEIVSGYLVGYTVLATVVSLNVLIELQLLFDLDYGLGRLAATYLVIWLLAVISMAIGILVSNVARTEGQVIPFIPLVIVPSFLFSGLVVAVDQLPGWGQVISRISPMYYANNVIQELVAGNTLTTDLVSFIALPVYAGVVLLLAALTLREQT